MSIIDNVKLAALNLADATQDLITPTIRLGVTGLSRSGKTVFITSLIHHLLESGDALPLFGPKMEGRFLGAQLTEQPDADVPTFAYQTHLNTLLGAQKDGTAQRDWPKSTRQISQIRLTLKFQRRGWMHENLGPSTLHLDIVDYPGEWLLDLPLLNKSYETFSQEALDKASQSITTPQAQDWLNQLGDHSANDPFDEMKCQQLSNAFRAHLVALKTNKDPNHQAHFRLPPGRFLVPGEHEGKPALNFSPFQKPNESIDPKGIYATMERRYEAYKDKIIRPFYLNHFARLDRQIVLVDLLDALNSGAKAVSELSTTLETLLTSFKHGKGSPLLHLFDRRIDKILFAATKADMVHHSQHEKLEQLMLECLSNAQKKVRFSNAQSQAIAFASHRATLEGELEQNGVHLPCLIGIPQKGEMINKERFDGTTKAAIFPGDLPDSLDELTSNGANTQLNYVKFRPVEPLSSPTPNLPHARLDRVVDYILSDKMQ